MNTADSSTLLTVQQWMGKVKAEWPEAEFVQEDGSGKTYGAIQEWTAHVGLDMQADTVGSYSHDFCCVETEESVAVESGLQQTIINHHAHTKFPYLSWPAPLGIKVNL